jgi:hypothetical protein
MAVKTKRDTVNRKNSGRCLIASRALYAEARWSNQVCKKKIARCEETDYQQAAAHTTAGAFYVEMLTTLLVGRG